MIKNIFVVAAAISLLTSVISRADSIYPKETHGIKLNYVDGDDNKYKFESQTPDAARRVDAAIKKFNSNLDNTLNNPNSVLLKALKDQKAKSVLVEIQIIDFKKISPECTPPVVQKEKGCAMTVHVSLFLDRDCITTENELFQLGTSELRNPGCKDPDSVEKDDAKDDDKDTDSEKGDDSKPSKKSKLKGLFHRNKDDQSN